MEKEKYWSVSHNADVTETGLTMNRTYIKSVWQGFPAQQFAEREILEDFCSSRFGSRAVFVQGVAPVPGWVLYAIDQDAYKEAQPTLWRGLPTETTVIELGIGGSIEPKVLTEHSFTKQEAQSCNAQ